MDAGTALGIVSLGIQVSKSLKAYYSSFNGAPDDVTAMRAAFEHLLGMLQTLEPILQSGNQITGVTATVVPMVETCVKTCQADIEKLDQELKKVEVISSPQRLRERIDAFTRRAKYPFKEGTLLKLKEIANATSARLALAMSILQLDVGTGITSRLGTVSQGVNRIEKHLESTQLGQKRNLVLSWLNVCEVQMVHDEAHKRRTPRTGEWLFQDKEWIDWFNSDERLLWLFGKVGCGKTVLFCALVEQLKRSADATVLHFYFSHKDSQLQSLKVLLTCLIREAYITRGSTHVEALYDQYKPNVPNAIVLQQCLDLQLQEFDEVIIAIDAVDECPTTEANNNKEDLFTWLAHVRQTSASTRIICTSRMERDILTLTRSLRAKTLTIEEKHTREDIRRYLLQQLESDSKLKLFKADDRTQILESLSRESNGMFQWAFCQVEHLKTLRTHRHKDVQRALGALPKDLHKTYERVLQNLDVALQPEIRRALHWIAYAPTPLTLEELAVACIIDPDKDPPLSDEDELSGSDLVAMLSSLISVSKKGSFIHLAHFSVKEYLEGINSPLSISRDLVHQYLARSCTLYITHSLRVLASSSQPEEQRFVLLRYAKRHVAHFLDKSNLTRETVTAVHPLLVDLRQAAEYVEYSVPLHFTKGIRHLLTRLQLSCLKILRQGADSDEKLSDLFEKYEEPTSAVQSKTFRVIDKLVKQRSPLDLEHALYTAAEQARIDIIALLLRRGVNVNQKSTKHSALHVAIEKSHLQTAQFLIQERADVKNVNLSALDEGCNVEMCRMLLENGAKVQSILYLFMQWLEDRSSRNHEQEDGISAHSDTHLELLHTLIDRGADVTLEDHLGRTPIQLAAGTRSKHIVSRLIRAGANVNAPAAKEHRTALQSAVRHAVSQNVQQLLDAGALVDMESGKDGTALMTACFIGNMEMVQLMLKAGANVNVNVKTDTYYKTALQIACAHQAPSQIITLLIEAGADVNAGGDFYTSPLHAACRDPADVTLISISDNVPRMHEIVRILLENGANANFIDPQGNTALHSLCRGQYLDVTDTLERAELLMKYGADLDVASPFGWTALELARFSGKTELASLLVSHGAKEILDLPGLELRNVKGLTRFAVCVQNRDLEGCKTLIERGADVYAWPSLKWPRGESLAHLAVQASWKEGIKLLYEKGALMDHVDDANLTPLGRAIKQADKDMVLLLLELGVATSGIQNSKPPLSLATAHECTEIIDILLDCAQPPSPTESSAAMAENSIHIAASRGLTLALKRFLATEDGALGIDLVSTSGLKSALAWALVKKHETAACVLFDAGASLIWDSPLEVVHAAASFGFDNLLVSILEKTPQSLDLQVPDTKETPLMLAASAGHFSTAKILVEQGANVNMLVGRGLTPLLIASFKGHSQIVKELLWAKAEVDLRTESGLTAAFWAAEQGHSEVLGILIKAGADVNAKALEGDTPLYWAASSGHLNTVDLLLEHGSNATISGKLKHTALHAAAAFGHSQVAERLLKHSGAELVDRTSIFSQTPLHLACHRDRDDVIQLLDKFGANTAILNETGRTAIDVAGSALPLLRKLGYTPTPSATSKVRTTRAFHRLISEFCEKPQARIANNLGVCLIFLGNVNEARMVLRTASTMDSRRGAEMVICDECSAVIDVSENPRFVCTTCAYVDLCYACKLKERIPARCKGHEFLRIEELPEEKSDEEILKAMKLLLDELPDL